jgi:hypothetical protein
MISIPLVNDCNQPATSTFVIVRIIAISLKPSLHIPFFHLKAPPIIGHPQFIAQSNWLAILFCGRLSPFCNISF